MRVAWAAFERPVPSASCDATGKPLKRLDGETAQFSADGIANDTRGEYAHWQTKTGTTMYRGPVKGLLDTQPSPDQLAGAVETATRTFLADGT